MIKILLNKNKNKKYGTFNHENDKNSNKNSNKNKIISIKKQKKKKIKKYQHEPINKNYLIESIHNQRAKRESEMISELIECLVSLAISNDYQKTYCIDEYYKTDNLYNFIIYHKRFIVSELNRKIYNYNIKFSISSIMEDRLYLHGFCEDDDGDVLLDF